MAMTAESLRGSLHFKIDLKNGLIQQPIRPQLMKGDKNANTVIVELTEDKKEVDLSGVTVTGSFISPIEGAEIPMTGSVDGNKAIVTLIDECYAEDGYFECHIKLTAGETSRTILSFTGYVLSKGSGALIDIGQVIPSLDDIIAQYKTMQDVTESTNAAKEAANIAAKYANDEAKKIDGLTVDATRTDMPSAEVSVRNGVRHISFGLVTPRITFEVDTGLPGTNVQIEQSGTPENPVVKLTIPRGNTGSLENMPLYNGTPEPLGTAAPGTSEDVARGDHVHAMPTAEQVGARPNDWTPSAADVGALPNDGTAADASKLGGNEPEYYMPDYGRGKVLWEGNWSSGKITVPDTGNYNGFKISFSGQGTAVLAIKQGVYIRGIGGYSTAENAIITYHFAATFDGDEWTFVASNRFNHNPSSNHGSVSNNVITSIIGLF